ncbi:Oligopeptide-binding protein AppA [Streptomyces sp. RB5]|uniref:Oligopeptide-binding protein AppA n=1 Tax=Streptomyces smaragdinus TaxID=2585196 RepID=A0A7K0CSN9_9ACTN|nr:ABC transporter substrate-binding protein [Streptomyces smaragdinus]MQY16448.1 Oligopeptide-binding protein AppA [Streptomyces smaragdinus]
MSMKRRSWHRAACAASLLLTATLTASACSPTPSDDDKDPSGKGGGRLTVARTGDIEQLDPARATAFQSVQTLGLVYDTLVDTDDSGELVPGLAEKWQVAPDGKAVELTLREGVKFHDGTPFTAADAKATLERNMAKETGSVVGSYLANITAVEADGATLTLTLKQPDASLLTALTYTGNAMLAKKDIDAGTVGKKPNGTGPFRWRKWKQNQRLELAANSAYFAGAPKVSTVEFRVIPDEASIASGMQAGSFDLGILSDPAVAKQVTGAKAAVTAQPTLAYHVLQLNARKGPLAKPEARQAIACAVDRQEIADAVYFGQAKVTGPITSPAYPYDPTAALPCEPGDTAAAKALLKKAGYPDGFELKTITMTGEYSTSTNIAQVLQAQLKKIGVTLELERQQTNVYVDNWMKGKFDAAVALNGGSVDPYLIYNRYFTKGASLTVPAGYDSPRLDELLAAANLTTDKTDRTARFDDLQKELLGQSPWVWLFANQVYYAVGTDLKGFKALPTESLEYLGKATVGR